MQNIKTVGQFLRDYRIGKNLSLDDIQDETRIKKEFIRAIESEEWAKLPELTVVIGFVKNIASALGIEQRQAVALLKRDYPPEKNVSLSPKPDIKEKNFTLAPKLAFAGLVTTILLVIIGYLFFQYKNFYSPPKLTLITPQNEQLITEKNLIVSGVTSPEATVRVNNQPVLPNEKGEFTTVLEINNDTKEIEVKAISRSGRETSIKQKIKVELN